MRGANDMLGTQLFITRGEEFNPNLITNVKNRDVKPFGGLWTSSFDVETKSAWIDFCTMEEFCLPSSGVWHGHLLTPDKKARIYVIDSLVDLKRLIVKYPYFPYAGIEFHGLSYFENKRYIDFESMSKDYDALHLTDRGQYATRNTEPFNLYGWDFESTLWFRDCFTNAVKVKINASIARNDIDKINKERDELIEKMRSGELLKELKANEKAIFEAMGAHS